jgi:hypothetical protein
MSTDFNIVSEVHNDVLVMKTDGYVNNTGGEQIVLEFSKHINNISKVVIDLEKSKVVNSIGSSYLLEMIETQKADSIDSVLK